MSAILPAGPALAPADEGHVPIARRWLGPWHGRLSGLRLPFRDLSYRFKIPFSVSVVILVTALIVSGVLIVCSYQYLRQDLVTGAESLGKTLSRALLPVMLHDELWQAYEIVITPFDKPDDLENADKVILVLDQRQQVYVSSHPDLFRTLEPLAAIGPSQSALSDLVARSQSTEPFVVENVVPGHIVVVVPILSEDGSRLGTLLLQYAEALFLPRFWATVRQVLLSTLTVLAILIPLGWFAGNRMAIPLLSLASAMHRVGSEPPSKIRAELYLAGGDEIGQLGRAFRGMLAQLEEKQALERQMIMSDRLASIGRLTAGIAHEINNPLGGMFNAINTFKHHGSADPVTARTISLLERGLTQIKETVGALLVEARIESHAVTREDLEDIRTLVAPEAAKKRLRIRWQNDIRGSVPLPSTPVRQVLINLLLNAVQAADERGHVHCRVAAGASSMSVCVENDGRLLSARQREHLFEPFLGDAGSGLGLWVTYQIVQQLKGEIGVDCGPLLTRFEVRLPIEEPA
jgi:two-component system NtrC family sensor kinase